MECGDEHDITAIAQSPPQMQLDPGPAFGTIALTWCWDLGDA